MHNVRLAGYVFSVVVVSLLLHACSDMNVQREKAEALSRKWVLENSGKIAAMISDVVAEKLPSSEQRETVTRDAVKSLHYLSTYVNPDGVSFPESRSGPWVTVFQSEFRIHDIRVSYHLIVLSRLGLISSVDEVWLKDIAIDGVLLNLNKIVY